MTQPFCCDITSGTKEEQNEFKRLFNKSSKKNWGYGTIYYGVDKYGVFDCGSDINYVINFMSKVFPLSEGISILKKMVGEEEKARTKLEDALQKELSWQMDVVIPDLENKLSDALFHIKELCDSIKSFDLAGQHIPCVKALEFFAHNEGFLKPIEDNKKDSDLPF